MRLFSVTPARDRCKYLMPAFSLVEVLVTTALIILLAAMLLPILGKAKESARYTAWRAMSQSISADPRLALYYNFQDQTGDEISARGEPIVGNKSQGDPMGLVASKESKRGADDPLMRYGVLKDSHPDDDTKGGYPEMQHGKGRFRNKTGAFFPGENLLPGVDVDTGSGGANGHSWALSKEGGYIKPDYWAGIVDKGEFQIGMWVKLEDNLSGQILCAWGERSKAPETEDDPNTFVQLTTGNSGNGKSIFEKVRGLSFHKERGGGANWRERPSDKKRHGIIVDNVWHFVVVRLKKPYNRVAPGLNSDPTVPELDDIELSIDGSPFKHQYNFWGKDDTENFNRRLERAVDTIVFGAAWYSNRGDDYWNKSRFIRGYIDEILVWQEPTTEDEIKRMYKNGAPTGHYASGFMTWKAARNMIEADGLYDE